MRKQRICLRCNNAFESDGPHNRICPNCHDRSPVAARRECGGPREYKRATLGRKAPQV